MSYQCEVCRDSGEVNQMGSLDCVFCDAAEMRAALNAAVASLPPMTQSDLVWYAFQAGRKAEAVKLADSLRCMWGWAIELGETSYFDDDGYESNDIEKAEWQDDIDRAHKFLIQNKIE